MASDHGSAEFICQTRIATLLTDLDKLGKDVQGDAQRQADQGKRHEDELGGLIPGKRRTLKSGEPVQTPLHTRVRERTIHLLSMTARRDERCRSTLDSPLQAHDRVFVDDGLE